MQRVDSDIVDLIVTSPPYDSLRAYKGFQFDFELVAVEMYRIIRPGGTLVWIVADETKQFCESLSSFKQLLFMVEVAGFNLLDTMVYAKKNGPAPYPGLMRYAPWFEYMFVLTKGRPVTFNPIKDIPTQSGAGKRQSGSSARQVDGSTVKTGEYISSQFRARSNVWIYDTGFNKDTKDKIALSHPARFPEALARDHILSWSNSGDMVYDPFLGSGTTAKMSHETTRRWSGSEISTEYCNLAIQRLKDCGVEARIDS